MWQTIAIVFFLHGVNAALSEPPAPNMNAYNTPSAEPPVRYYAAPMQQSAPPLMATVQPRASGRAAVEPARPVMLRLSVYEVSLTKLRRLGFGGAKVEGDAIESFDMDKMIAELEGNAAFKGTVPFSSARKSGQSPIQSGQGTIGFGVMDEKDDLNASIKALSKDGLVKVLAAPTLMTMSGRAASFHIGGEIPVPRPDGKGKASVEYKKFGTMVDFHPTILKNNRIRLELQAEVADLDREHSVVIAGEKVPGVRSRSVDTACEMKSGQVLVLSGLHQRQTVETAAEAGNEKTKKTGPEQPKAKSATEETVLLFTVKAEIVEPMDGKWKTETARRAGDGGVIRN